MEKTGRKKLIVAGVSTEICVAFVALSAVKVGYEVYAVIDASGTWNKLVQEVAVACILQIHFQSAAKQEGEGIFYTRSDV